MERVQPTAAPASGESSQSPEAVAPDAPACVACHGAVDGTRCPHCGAARVAGSYRVLQLIAQTEHSRMYVAQGPDGRRVALKELMFALVPGMEQLAAFERESSVLRELTHAQIPAFITSFAEGSGVGTRLYLAQEFIDGESLLQKVTRQRLTEREAWNIAEQALEVLHYLHTRTPALVHRDVKPANLILRERGPMALVDFGAVRGLARGMTHGSTLVGTFGYMPPEQLGGTVDATSDLYAVGATIIHGLTGKAPVDLLVEGIELQFERHLPDVSGELRAFLRKLVAPRRSGRFRSAEEALVALRARSTAVLRVDAVRRMQELAGKGRSRGRRYALLAAALLGGAGATALLAGAGAAVLRLWLVRAPSPVVNPGPAVIEPVQPARDPEPPKQLFEQRVEQPRLFLDEVRSVSVAVGEIQEFYSGGLDRIAVMEPEIADARVRNGRVVVLGVAPGVTRVITWSTTNERREHEIVVRPK